MYYRARNYDSNLGFRSENLPQPEGPSLSFSIYQTIPGFPVGNPAKNLGFCPHLWVSHTYGNLVISSPALVHVIRMWSISLHHFLCFDFTFSFLDNLFLAAILPEDLSFFWGFPLMSFPEANLSFFCRILCFLSFLFFLSFCSFSALLP